MVHCITTTGLSDQALIARFQTQGDQQALLMLLQRHKAIPRAMVRRFGLPISPEDFVQDVYLILYDVLADHREIKNFPAWLKTLVHHRLCDRSRRLNNFQKFETHCQDQPTGYQSSVVEEMDRKQLAQVALTQVNADESDCLRLRYYGGMSYQEVADELDLSFKQVCGRLSRGLQKMRRNIAPVPY
jgi:RNA polymerase sigma-70 factor (ECF subfamily)